MTRLVGRRPPPFSRRCLRSLTSLAPPKGLILIASILFAGIVFLVPFRHQAGRGWSSLDGPGSPPHKRRREDAEMVVMSASDGTRVGSNAWKNAAKGHSSSVVEAGKQGPHDSKTNPPFPSLRQAAPPQRALVDGKTASRRQQPTCDVSQPTPAWWAELTKPEEWWRPLGLKARPKPVVYFLHLHKCGGSFLCQAASKVYGTKSVSLKDNCNVPVRFWGTSEMEGRQKVPYFGNTAAGLEATYRALATSRIRFAANEGSLEDSPLTCISDTKGTGPYL